MEVFFSLVVNGKTEGNQKSLDLFAFISSSFYLFWTSFHQFVLNFTQRWAPFELAIGFGEALAGFELNKSHTSFALITS